MSTFSKLYHTPKGVVHTEMLWQEAFIAITEDGEFGIWLVTAPEIGDVVSIRKGGKMSKLYIVTGKTGKELDLDGAIKTDSDTCYKLIGRRISAKQRSSCIPMWENFYVQIFKGTTLPVTRKDGTLIIKKI